MLTFKKVGGGSGAQVGRFLRFGGGVRSIQERNLQILIKVVNGFRFYKLFMVFY